MTLAMRQTNQLGSVNAELFEKVMLKSDLEGLSPVETVQHIKNICESLGLNPLTNPIEVIAFQGKKKLYFRKEATEQLRLRHKISVSIVETKIVDDLYIVIAEAKTPDGRQDSSTAAITIGNLKGEAKANAIMKAETKAKRRVTLSICGLGFTDESEIETIPNYSRVNIRNAARNQTLIENKNNNENDDLELQDILLNLSQITTLDELEKQYKIAYKKYVVARDNKALAKVMEAKDAKKKEIETIKQFNDEIDKGQDTGEVLA